MQQSKNKFIILEWRIFLRLKLSFTKHTVNIKLLILKTIAGVPEIDLKELL